jgi:hypothetical protein
MNIAEELRELSNSVNERAKDNVRNTRSYKRIVKSARKKASKGETLKIISWSTSDLVQSALKADGFRITTENCGDYLVLRW